MNVIHPEHLSPKDEVGLYYELLGSSAETDVPDYQRFTRVEVLRGITKGKPLRFAIALRGAGF